MDGPQPFGPEASARLTQLLAGREVLLERDVVGLDHYGRSLRHVWLGDTLAAEVLIAEGLAYAQSIPPNTLHADRLERAEAAARQAKVGLWGLPRPTPLPLFASPSP
jgi:micrococcal nuclease